MSDIYLIFNLDCLFGIFLQALPNSIRHSYSSIESILDEPVGFDSLAPYQKPHNFF